MERPVTSGDYITGNLNSRVAVVTLASAYRTWNLKNYVICGHVLQKISESKK